jgi:uncharacterized membrane protein YphA (DoxX/SURF4 family)
MTSNTCSAYAPIVLRLAISAVYVWFGVSQITNGASWTGLVPDWATTLSGMEALTIVHFNGVFEVIAGTLLAIGFYARPIAALLAAHLFVITTHIGLTATGIRDFGLSFATLSVALFGEDTWCMTRTSEATKQ